MKSRVALGTVLIAAAMLAACDSVPLLAPRESTISVTAQTLSLAPGGTTTITALVMESGGNAVHDGTRVSFSATLGRVEPAEVETRGGTATTTFVAGATSGTAQVRAMSGAATASGTTGEGTTATAGNVVQIAIGGAATTAVTVSASPSRVGPSGGTVTIVGSALDAAGNRLVGVPISFSADVGRLSASSALSDSAGEARVTLTTDRQAVVTARSGAQNATVTVTVATAATVALQAAPAAPLVNAPVTLTLTPTGSPRVIVNWGDGSTEDLGVVAATRTATHVYLSPGAYTVTATATADGESFSTAVPVVVSAAPAVGVTVAASSSTAVECTPITFTATLTGDATASVSRYTWTIDSNTAAESETVITTGNQLSRAWPTFGRKTISVTATTTDGRTGNGQTQVVITAPATPGRGC